jgi:plasmid stabilization system protein ParE
MKIEYSDIAILEIDDAYAYYLGESGRGLADRFYANLKSTIQILADSRFDLGTLKYKNSTKTKCITLNKFPYVVFFRRNLGENLVVVGRVFHQRMDILRRLEIGGENA